MDFVVLIEGCGNEEENMKGKAAGFPHSWESSNLYVLST